jgi:6-phosphogluconolactonase (cycloisomerase 2 family)
MVSGLAGTGLVLASGGTGSVAVSADGTFTLPTGITQGTNYVVTVTTQPTGPAQTCTVTNGSGVMAAANVTNVAVACVTNNYTIGGTVSGLAGSGLALRINGGGQITPTNGAFTFGSPLASGTVFAVTVATQPVTPHQTCVLANAGGTVAAANITNVTVTCTTNQYSVRGTASGLVGSGLTLQVNGGNDLLISNNGDFEFTNAVGSGQNFTVTIDTQPATPAQTCLLYSSTGTVTNAAVDGVELKCTTSGARFAYVGGVQGMYCYGIDGVSGSLFPLGAPQCDLGGLNHVAVSPTGLHAFAVDSGTNQVIPYSINQTTGIPERLSGGARATGSNPLFVAVYPNGQYLYVANANSNNISIFGVDVATGALTSIGTTATGNYPSSLAIDRSGSFLYVTNGNSNSVSGFIISPANGNLAQVAGSPFTVMTNPRDVVIDPSNKFAYVASSVANRVHAFRMNSTTGALVQVTGSPYVSGTTPIELAVDSTAKYLYSTNIGNMANSLSAWSIDTTTGALTAVPGAPFPRTGGTWGVAAHPSAGFLYVSNSGAGTISSLSIAAATGAPTEFSFVNSSGGPTGTFGITIVP